MSASQIALTNYNILYSGMRSIASSRGMSFEVKTFHDGSAVINFVVTARNATVSLSACVAPKYDADNNIIGYHVSDDDYTIDVERIYDSMNVIRRLISEARNILNRV